MYQPGQRETDWSFRILAYWRKQSLRVTRYGLRVIFSTRNSKPATRNSCLLLTLLDRNPNTPTFQSVSFHCGGGFMIEGLTNQRKSS
jgi:hypothetical protein